MLQSMTGFGKASGTFENKKITIEIKSLNSKNMDIFVRMPSIYKAHEIALRKEVGAALDRGKIELNILIESAGVAQGSTVNKELVKSYYAQLEAISKELNLPSEDRLATVMRMPDIYASQQEENNEITEEEWAAVLDLVKKAIVEHKNFRLVEGKHLQNEFEERIGAIQHAFDQVPALEKERIDSIKGRIENNLNEFVGADKVDKNRFEQELIYYIEKIDIAEEKHRLQNHLTYFLEILNESKSQGKKLGFIGQEIGREINTLGSKSYHAEMQKLVVNMKDELEKIKEQILNTL
jgi:uncharacterized protein (TIGR00255 family)